MWLGSPFMCLSTLRLKVLAQPLHKGSDFWNISSLREYLGHFLESPQAPRPWFSSFVFGPADEIRRSGLAVSGCTPRASSSARSGTAGSAGATTA